MCPIVAVQFIAANNITNYPNSPVICLNKRSEYHSKLIVNRAYLKPLAIETDVLSQEAESKKTIFAKHFE